jgi:hypothetical protein
MSAPRPRRAETLERAALQSGIAVLTDLTPKRPEMPNQSGSQSTEKRYRSPETSHARAFGPCSAAIGRPGCAPRAP